MVRRARASTEMGCSRARRPPDHEVVSGYLDAVGTATILAAINGVRATMDLPVIVRQAGNRSLQYQVMDGSTVNDHLPVLTDLYQRVRPTVEGIFGRAFVPLGDPLAALNVNITPPGGGYRWHYDRNAATALLYLNNVAGGQLEMCPGYRVTGAWLRRVPRLQQILDAGLRFTPVRRVAGSSRLIRPSAGTLVVMRGDRCLHSVRPVLEGDDRICVVMSFDIPGGAAASNSALDDYLYTSRKPGGRADPNYPGHGTTFTN